MNFLEKEILGCFLKDNTLLSETIIQPRYFESESSKLLFQSMVLLANEGKAVDKVTLLATNYEYIQQLGGPAFIADLETKGVVDHFESYERQFLEQYKRRESERITSEWMSTKEKDNEDLISSLQKLDDVEFSDEIDKNELLKKMENLPFMENVADAGVSSGLESLDAITGGFQKENSYILGARPSMGWQNSPLYQ